MPYGDEVLTKQALDHLLPVFLGRVLQFGTHEVEAEGWPPVHNVADEDAVFPVRETTPRERGERTDEVEAV
ncbi:MAG TPA: hypothetical protein VHM69_05855 [Rubrobacter sp.]|nr:hypothetical protein [Rubrobacter sp.]